MTVVVVGIDALDPSIVDPARHPNLTLASHRSISTIISSAGEPSTHELWPTIITGLEPTEHGLVVDDGVAWEHPLLAAGSRVGKYVLPESVRVRIGAWLLNSTSAEPFRTPARYYADREIGTVFDDRRSAAIGIPNYVVEGDAEDREHQLRRSLGELFKRDPRTASGHRSSDPEIFYDQCLEMAMIRIARVRRALRSERYELVFGYTSGLDLVGHVSFDVPGMQAAAYGELDEFVGELVDDLADDDVLVLVSDHGLQNGVHTDEAMVASTEPDVVDSIEDVTTVRRGLERALENGTHEPDDPRFSRIPSNEGERAKAVSQQLEDLGYI